jgi:hypothetical protein
MNKVTIGLLLALSSLILLHNNQPFIGFPAFIVGIFLMMHKKK